MSDKTVSNLTKEVEVGYKSIRETIENKKNEEIPLWRPEDPKEKSKAKGEEKLEKTFQIYMDDLNKRLMKAHVPLEEAIEGALSLTAQHEFETKYGGGSKVKDLKNMPYMSEELFNEAKEIAELIKREENQPKAIGPPPGEGENEIEDEDIDDSEVLEYFKNRFESDEKLWKKYFDGDDYKVNLSEISDDEDN